MLPLCTSATARYVTHIVRCPVDDFSRWSRRAGRTWMSGSIATWIALKNHKHVQK